jgi:hypothetical protein
MFVNERRERSVDVMRADTVDAELDRLISKRASQDRGQDPDELEPGYLESVRRFNARVRAENRAAWSEYHRGQAERLRRNLEELITHHETQAARLCESKATEGAA